MSLETSPGSNWSALQSRLKGSDSAKKASRPNRRRRSDALPRKTMKVKVVKQHDKPPENLPWFAEDLTPEDLAMVLANSDTESMETDSQIIPAVSVAKLKQNSVQWKGYLDEETRRKAILGGDEKDYSPEKKQLGHYIAVDCEMVGVGAGARRSALARVTLVNWHGYVVYDQFVRPQETVTDYRTWVSGVRAGDLKKAPSFAKVQKEVADLIKDRVLVGHAIQNDLRALMLSHPRPMIRDTAEFQPLRDLVQQKHPGLRALSKIVLGLDIQKKGHAHSPVEDARSTMALFRTQKDVWDQMLGIHKGERHRKRNSADMSADFSVDQSAATFDKPALTQKSIKVSPKTSKAPTALSTVQATRVVHEPMSKTPSRGKAKPLLARVKAVPDWWLNE
ncbi:3'-5' exonuclease [Malassezia yamatoensis]|uniref:RNA exonuclease 4 n=1 Tax=Malassezia yamatoensis TaxID=253288 RepID=A0AAJ6CHS4_9BASI|nr:3'-5' exonuclease [Malassezia yamatoensis]